MSIDLFLWEAKSSSIEWSGEVFSPLHHTDHPAMSVNHFVHQSKAEFLLFWSDANTLPSNVVLNELIATGLDLAHVGLKQGSHLLWPDLCLVLQDWTMIAGEQELPCNSWWITPEACFLRREMFVNVGGWDEAFISPHTAALEFGYRALRLGALVEYRPELLPTVTKTLFAELPARDFYTFVLRHFGRRWGRYVWLRRSVRRMSWWREWRTYKEAEKACTHIASPLRQASPVWYDSPPQSKVRLEQTPISVIIPTLGRYPYLPQALQSLREQTVRPREVIVVDQNPPEQRQPETYLGYEDLHLQVIWQDEQGQSLARNTGLAAASQPYVFLFDDDSIADPHLIAAHLQLVLNGRCHVSTGVAFPPPPSTYQLPAQYRHTRIAQTFDTGNSLLSLDLARKMGGLDRNYDFGPGTDSDFGTRLYLAGYRIAHNPQARRIHFKAPIGGLRTHGARKYNTDTDLWQPFPPVTQSYYGLRYLNRQQQFERTWLSFFTSKFPPELRQSRGPLVPKLKAAIYFGLAFLLLPLKWLRSHKQARQLLQQGVRLAEFAP